MNAAIGGLNGNCVADMTKTSFYIGNRSEDVVAGNAWLGRNLDAIQVHGGSASWDDLLGSIHWQAAQVFRDTAADIMWSVPLIPKGATLEAAASGEYSDKYLTLAKQMLADRPADQQIYIRLGWEMNGAGWTPWSAVGHEQAYVGAFRNFVNVFRSVSDKFVFEWTPNVGNVGMNPENAYPGDNYVDVIGMDFYYNTQWDSKNPTEAWNYFVNQQYGLQWHQDFAAAHNKPTAYAEWGINSDSPTFVELAAKWFADHNVLYQNYWNSDAAFNGSLMDGEFPNAAAAYMRIFGSQPETGPVVVVKTSTASPSEPASTTPTSVQGSSTPVETSTGARNLVGTGASDTITGTSGNDSISGGNGEGVLRGGSGSDTIVGGVDFDDINGNAGDDTASGGAGNDWVVGGKDNDRLFGDLGDDLVYGNLGQDWCDGGDGDDIIRGGQDNDVLFGGRGNDWLSGDRGNDTITGGAGADIFHFSSDAGVDRVIDFNKAEGDRILFDRGMTYSISQSGADTVISTTGGGQLVLVGVSAASLSNDWIAA